MFLKITLVEVIKIKLIFLCLFFCSILAKAELPEGYQISKIQNPYIDTKIEVYEINDYGFIVGGYYLKYGDRIGGGIIWKDSQIYSLGPIGGPIYDHINNNGDVADSKSNIAFINSKFYEFKPYGAIESIKIKDLNDNGILVLDHAYTNEDGVKRCEPELFDGYAGEAIGIPYFNDSDYSFHSLGINNNNIIVGTSIYYDSLGRYAIQWPAICDIKRYNPIDPSGNNSFYQAEFKDINDSGVILGNYFYANKKSFLWTEKDGIIASFGGREGAQTYCYSVNNLSQVIGWVGTDSFIWDPDDGFVYLKDLLPKNSGWSYLTAIDINNSGTMIGRGVFNGNIESFVMEPVPEPTSLLLLAAGGLLVRRK